MSTLLKWLVVAALAVVVVSWMRVSGTVAPGPAPTSRFVTKDGRAISSEPAPAGDPKKVARAAIADAGHPCGRVKVAARLPTDGSIIADCTNGERYRIFRLQPIDEVAAVRCSAVEKRGGTGCG